MISFAASPTFITSTPSIVASSPIGLESNELQHSTLKPVEQPSKSASLNHSVANNSLYSQYRDGVEGQGSMKELLHNQTEQAIIQKLAKLDREVRNHEQAHAAVGGKYAGAPKYEYQRGPDGVYYAVAGEVSIDISPVAGDPQATIEKAQTIRRAALAPAEPSTQDRIVAAEASKMEMEARNELNREVAEMKAKDNQNISVDDHEKADDASVDALNQVQEHAFSDISNEITEQLIAFNSANMPPKSLGNIINHTI